MKRMDNRMVKHVFESKLTGVRVDRVKGEILIEKFWGVWVCANW